MTLIELIGRLVLGKRFTGDSGGDLGEISGHGDQQEQNSEAASSLVLSEARRRACLVFFC